MKRIFKYLTVTSLSAVLCLFLAIPANAQRGGHGGGGGGGFHGGGGGGGFHGGGGYSGGSRGGFSGGARGGSNVSAGRPSGSYQRGSSNVRSYSGGSRVVTGGARVNAGVGVGARGYVSGNRVYAGGGRAGVYAGGRAGVYGGRAGVYGGRGYFGARGGYFYNRGFYGSLYYPRLGLSFGFLPYGYYPFYWGDLPYYYSNGYYYNYNDGQYTVVEPPVGAAINTLPSSAQAITINGQQYYELNGVYYLPVTKDDGSVVYQIAGKDGQLDTNSNDGGGQMSGDQGQQQSAPMGNGNADTHPIAKMGDMIQSLPQDSRKVNINGQTLYVTPDDVYLKQTTDSSGNKAYSVVGVPNE